jgi:large conductance mechanosensitive channel
VTVTGFKKFILKGNLIEVAVALIMALAFAAVVTAFVAWLTSLMPDSVSNIFSDTEPFGAFMNAVIAFVLLAVVIYFFVVLPYTKARERFFPEEDEETPVEIALLQEIRDLLKQGNRPS